MSELQQSRFDEIGPFSAAMHTSEGTGLPLLKHGSFGADLIHFESGNGVRTHTHPGSHILLCTAGSGIVVYDGVSWPLSPGMCYLVPGNVPHSVYAAGDSSLTLVAIANDHRPVDSPERLEAV